MAEHTGRDTFNFTTGLGTMFPDGCHAGYSSDDKKKEVPLSEDRTQDPEPL